MNIFKIASLVKPPKVVRKQGSPIFMKFYGQVTPYPNVVNLNISF